MNIKSEFKQIEPLNINTKFINNKKKNTKNMVNEKRTRNNNKKHLTEALKGPFHVEF